MAEIFDNVSEGRCEPVLLCAVQLSPLRGEIEDVDGDFAFSVNKCDFDITFALRKGSGEFTQQTWCILRDYLQ